METISVGLSVIRLRLPDYTLAQPQRSRQATEGLSTSALETTGGPLALAGQGGALGTFDAALMGYDARARAVEEAPTGGAVRETTLSPSELDRERFDAVT